MQGSVHPELQAALQLARKDCQGEDTLLLLPSFPVVCVRESVCVYECEFVCVCVCLCLCVCVYVCVCVCVSVRGGVWCVCCGGCVVVGVWWWVCVRGSVSVCVCVCVCVCAGVCEHSTT